jgi:hypothetical protein
MNDRIDGGHRLLALLVRALAGGQWPGDGDAGNGNGPVLRRRKRRRMAKKSRPAEIPSASARQATPAAAEAPTSSAGLHIRTTTLSGTATANVPPNDARYMITTFGIMGTLFIGIGGTVLTLRVSAALTGVALAELLVTVVTIIVIALSSRTRADRSSDQRQ